MCLPTPLHILIDLSPPDTEVHRHNHSPPRRPISPFAEHHAGDSDIVCYHIKPSYEKPPATARSYYFDDDDDDSNDYQPPRHHGRKSHHPTTTTYTKTTYYKTRPPHRSWTSSGRRAIVVPQRDSFDKRIHALEQRALTNDVVEKVKGKIVGSRSGFTKGQRYEELWEYREPRIEPGRWVVERKPIWD